MDADNHYCYLEMVSLLLGEHVMNRLRDENQIKIAGSKGELKHTQIKKVEFEKQELTPHVKNQIELKLTAILAHVNTLTRGTQLIRD